jgi:3-methyladenine DNA glycosylase AlkC
MANALKDMFNKTFFQQLTKQITQSYPVFDADLFYQLVMQADWEELALKQRIRQISLSLHQTLPPDYNQALSILKAVAPQLELEEDLLWLIFPDFVEVYGLDHWAESMVALEFFTPFSTSEFAVRPFIRKDPERMIQQMKKWAGHPNEHVRRLASEGSRPRLPWGMGVPVIKQDPWMTLPILELLKKDESQYVRKSVANHLNDISKDHPEFLLNLAKQWLGTHPHTDWIVKHACRTLLKKGNQEALMLFGFRHFQTLDVQHFQIARPEIQIGDDLEFSFDLLLENTEECKVRIEYALEYVRFKGKHSKRIFKISEVRLSGKQRYHYQRRHSFQDRTTRKHYPGLHTL